MKLNLGCGQYPLPGYINLDADPNAPADRCASVPPLPFADGVAEEIWACHFLEHLTRDQAETFVAECRRVLQPGGRLGLVVPDTREILRRYLAGGIDCVEYGARQYWPIADLDCVCALFLYSTVQETPHQWSWDELTLGRLLAMAGFVEPRPIDRYRDPRLGSGQWYQCGLEAVRPEGAMKILLWWSGAASSVTDVASGIDAGLSYQGCEIAHYRTNHRMVASGRWLHSVWRRQAHLRKAQGLPPIPKPTEHDAVRHASDQLVTRAWRLKVDWVVCVSGLWIDPDAFAMLRQLGIRVALVCTESPYQSEWELTLARAVDHVWTNERTCVDRFRTVCPSATYLRHAWHPEIHRSGVAQAADVPAHDVVFVGTGWQERLDLLEGIDWTGIDLGLYGHWEPKAGSPLHACIRGEEIPNPTAAALYRRAAIGLNLHRTSTHYAIGVPVAHVAGAESLNPRAYELAACGLFYVSDFRPEVEDVFGSTLPTFRTPAEAESLIRHWLGDPAGRAARAAELRACVTDQHWRVRGNQMLADLAGAATRRTAA